MVPEHIFVAEGLSPNTVADRMMALFAGHPDVHGTHGEPELDSNGIKWGIKSTARTYRQPVTVELWRQHLAGTYPLGVVPIRPDNNCHWGSIDYDQYDDDMLRIVEAVDQLDLPLVPCRSKSGGLHLFLFLLDAQSAGTVQTILREFAAQVGASGSEIFPKQSKVLTERGDMGNWMVMPYFGGNFGGKLREQVGLLPTGAENTIEQFLDIAESKRLTAAQFEAVANQRRRRGRTREAPFPPFGDGPPCLEFLSSGGFPQGGRNNGLFMMGLYYKKKAPGSWQRELEQANHQFMNPALGTDETAQVIRQLEKRDYEYTCSTAPMCNHCDKVLCRTRKYGISNSTQWPTITGITKLSMDPIIWFVDVDGHRVACGTDQLFNYNQFNKLCLEQLDKCYLPMKTADWNGVLNVQMESLQTIEAPADVAIETGGQLREVLNDFLANRAVGQRKEDLLTGRPWPDDEMQRYYFRMRDFIRWAQREGFRDIKLSQIYLLIERLKGGHHFFNMQGVGVNVWWLPFSQVQKTETPTDGSGRRKSI